MIATRLRRYLAAALFMCGFAFVGLATYDRFFAAPIFGVVVEGEAERDFPTAVAGATIELTFPLHNQGSRTARVIGFATC